jgi:fucose 4-O-acetylase-like acetyltransferase
MNASGKTTGIVLDVRITLAALWIAGMLASLNGDTYRLSDPDSLKAMLANTGPIVTTPGLLLVMSLIFVVPILMSVLTLMLKYPVSRGANRIMGIIYAIIILVFWVIPLVLRSPGYAIVWSTAQLVFALLVVWYAWKWPNQEA